MPIVPACSTCNRFYGVIEQRLRRKLALCVDPANPAIAGVQARVWRSMDTRRAGTIKENLARIRNRRSLKAALRVINMDQAASAMPTPLPARSSLVTTPEGLLARGVPAIHIDPNDYEILICKFVRGAYFLERAHALPLPVHVDPIVMTIEPMETAKRLVPLMNRHGGAPPAFEYWGAIQDDDPHRSIWMFLVWQNFLWCGSTGVTRTNP